MRKYWLIFKLNLAEAFVYRATSFIWFFCDFAPALVLVIFWVAVFAGKDSIAGFSLADMLLYYFGVMIISTIIIPHPAPWLAEQIRTGQFAPVYLLKPVSVFWERLCSQISWRLIRLLFTVPASILVGYWLRDYLGDFTLPLNRLLVLILALILSFIGQLFFKICLGLAAIWFGDSFWMIAFWDMLMALLGGAYFPLDIYPPLVQTVSLYLPWRYFFYFPLSIFLGQVDSAGTVQGFFWLGFWLIVAGLTYRLVLTRGIKNYSAFGG